MDAGTRQALEAILFVADEPVDVSTLSQVLEVGRREVEDELADIARTLDEQERGFVLREVGDGWRFYSAPAAAPYLERWVLTGRSGRLSQAALETLAVVAYKQPITRQEIGDIRGVNVDGVVRTLEARDLVREVGRDEGPGQAIRYGTTRQFLEKLGLRDLTELPPLARFLADGPAPDEPAPGDLRRAREHLQSGADLPATGRARWDPETDAVPLRAGREREMDELSDALERAARNAMAVLDGAVAAADAEAEGDEERAGDGDPGPR